VKLPCGQLLPPPWFCKALAGKLQHVITTRTIVAGRMGRVRHRGLFCAGAIAVLVIILPGARSLVCLAE